MILPGGAMFSKTWIHYAGLRLMGKFLEGYHPAIGAKASDSLLRVHKARESTWSTGSGKRSQYPGDSLIRGTETEASQFGIAENRITVVGQCSRVRRIRVNNMLHF